MGKKLFNPSFGMNDLLTLFNTSGQTIKTHDYGLMNSILIPLNEKLKSTNTYFVFEGLLPSGYAGFKNEDEIIDFLKLHYDPLVKFESISYNYPRFKYSENWALSLYYLRTKLPPEKLPPTLKLDFRKIPKYDNVELPIDDIQKLYKEFDTAHKTSLLHLLDSLHRTLLCHAAFERDEKSIIQILRSSMYIHSIFCLLNLTLEKQIPGFLNSLDTALKNKNISQIYKLLELEVKSKSRFPFLNRLGGFF